MSRALLAFIGWLLPIALVGALFGPTTESVAVIGLLLLWAALAVARLAGGRESGRVGARARSGWPLEVVPRRAHPAEGGRGLGRWYAPTTAVSQDARGGHDAAGGGAQAVLACAGGAAHPEDLDGFAPEERSWLLAAHRESPDEPWNMLLSDEERAELEAMLDGSADWPEEVEVLFEPEDDGRTEVGPSGAPARSRPRSEPGWLFHGRWRGRRRPRRAPAYSAAVLRARGRRLPGRTHPAVRLPGVRATISSRPSS